MAPIERAIKAAQEPILAAVRIRVFSQVGPVYQYMCLSTCDTPASG